MGAYGGYLAETFVTLVVVCGLAVLVLWGAKRLGVGRATGSIKLVGQLPLDARRIIYLVKVGELVYVVGVGEAGFTKLGEIPAKDLPQPEPEKDAFAKVLERVLKKKGADERAASPKGEASDQDKPERSEGLS